MAAPVLTAGRLGLAALFVTAGAVAAPAQIVETVGTRALGMGGAFVAVANDSSATWWNPAGLAAGPFLDIALARASTDQRQQLPGWRDRGSWFAIGTPPFGLSYYRLRMTHVGPFEEPAPAGESLPGGMETPIRSLAAGQFGITLLQTVVDGVHVGTTLKYVRGTFLETREPVPDAAAGPDAPVEQIHALLRRGESLGGGRAQHRFDLDLGVLGVKGAFRAGGVFRNVRRPRFGDALVLPRQVRIGGAFEGDRVGLLPLTVAVDADLRTYETVAGPRRVVAVGAEQWVLAGRIALRAGARFNRAGARERAGTIGGSYEARPGLFLDGHVVRGGAPGERGWGLGARVSF